MTFNCGPEVPVARGAIDSEAVCTPGAAVGWPSPADVPLKEVLSVFRSQMKVEN